MEVQNKKWYVVYTKPRYEKKVDFLLKQKKIESWCPLQKITKQWSDRKKVIEETLFKSYVFVRISPEDRMHVMMTDGVINFVRYLGKDAIIRDEEIDTIKRYLSEKVTIEVCSTSYFEEKMKVRVMNGVFMDMHGTVLKSNNKRVYVELKSLGQIMVVDFPKEHLIVANY